MITKKLPMASFGGAKIFLMMLLTTNYFSNTDEVVILYNTTTADNENDTSHIIICSDKENIIAISFNWFKFEPHIISLCNLREKIMNPLLLPLVQNILASLQRLLA